MSVQATVLFDQPQTAIWSEITDRISRSKAVHIVSGFATPGGLKAIERPILEHPDKIQTIVLGAATYPGFEALDALLAAGVPSKRLFVHLGHTRNSRSTKNPATRYHPMLHSKIYYMEFPDDEACAFIGSHNMTSFALTGLNGEAGVLLEGPKESPEFEKIRRHIREAKQQAVSYSPAEKNAFAWWTREYLDGLKAEVRLSEEWTTIRTILIFAQGRKLDRPSFGNILYFELPAGIEQIESLKTEVHLFLFDTMPRNPWDALQDAGKADACCTCKVQGADNKQGNREITANWFITDTNPPQIKEVGTATLRPTPSAGMQQVRAEVFQISVEPFQYSFQRESLAWDPTYEENDADGPYAASSLEEKDNTFIRADFDWGHDPDDRFAQNGWRLVTGLQPREADIRERDAPALEFAKPESGSFILVSLRRRKPGRVASKNRRRV